MNTHNRWTATEVTLLKKVYPFSGRQEIYRLLPHRSHKSIDSKANKFHLRQHYENRFSSFDTKFIDELPEPTKAYIAGFFDGEGTIGIRIRKRPYNTSNPNHQLFVACTNTNEAVIVYLHDIWGGSLFKQNDTRERRRASYKWALSSYKAMQFLSCILPYLIVKREEATVAISFQETFQHEGYIIPAEIIEKRNHHASQLSELKGRLH